MTNNSEKVKIYNFNEVRNSVDVTASFVQHSLDEINYFKAYVAEKLNELSIYKNSLKALNESGGEKCLVFIGDNLFVERNLADGRQMLARMIQERQKIIDLLQVDLSNAEKRVRLLKCVNVDGDGCFEIHENFEGPSTKNTKRIAHTPKCQNENGREQAVKCEPLTSTENLVSAQKSETKDRRYSVAETHDQIGSKQEAIAKSKKISENVSIQKSETKGRRHSTDVSRDLIDKRNRQEEFAAKQKELMTTKPKGISEEDFCEFARIVDEIVGEDDASEDECYDEEDNDENTRSVVSEDVAVNPNVSSIATSTNSTSLKCEPASGDVSTGEGMAAKKRVHFSENLCDFREDASLTSVVTEDIKVRPILRNKCETSPINEPWIRKIKKKEEPKKIQSIPTTVLSNMVIERNVQPTTNEALKNAPDKTHSARQISKFKKMQLEKKAKS